MKTATSSPDLVVRNGLLLTLDREARVIAGDLWVSDGRIAALAEPGKAPDSADTSPQVLDATDCVVLPGFVQGHLHLGQTLFRGLAEGRRLLPWLSERIWPLEAAHDDESAYWSGMLGAAECLLGGTTTIQDIGLGPGARGLLQAICDSGLRAFAGRCLMDTEDSLPAGLASATEKELELTEELGNELESQFDRAEGGRVRYCLNPRFILSCSDPLWRELRALSERRGWPVHTHALEQEEEGEQIRAQLGRDEIEYFEERGLLDGDLRIAHGVQLQPRHLQRLRGRRFSVAHCPSSNLKLGSGIADLVALQRAGIAVGVGADGAPCNNDLDILEEIRLAALLQQLKQGPGSFGSLDALRLATSEGARALNLDEHIGALEPGKAADLVVLSCSRPELWPPHLLLEPALSDLGASVYDQIVYASSRAAVKHVVVDGRPLVVDGALTQLDPEQIRRRAADSLRKLLARARIPS